LTPHGVAHACKVFNLAPLGALSGANFGTFMRLPPVRAYCFANY
jgi:hypothetical protein